MAIAVAATAVYIQSIRKPGSGLVLEWLGKLGLVSQPTIPAPVISVIDSVAPELAKIGLARGPTVVVSGVPELTEASAFAVNDENALALLFLTAIFLAGVSIIASLCAEFRREPNIFLSAGYVCAALALVMVRPLAGLVAFIFGALAILVLRYQRENSST
jgi:hypothetical protein